MSTHRVAKTPLTSRQENQLRRVRKGFQDQGFLDVLDSFQVPESFIFRQTQKSGSNAIKLFLGNRPKANGSSCQAWAGIVTAERKDLKPPVIFYDQESSEDGTRTFQYPRSASSLLRKGTGLHPPFCFLQHDPIDKATGLRNMLCAVILYQALVTGVEACALQWTGFQDGLSQALQHINSCGAYHQWRHEQGIVSISLPGAIKVSKQEVQEEAEEEKVEVQADDLAAEQSRTASISSNNEYIGGIVRPSVSGVVIRPGSSLARLKDQLGDDKFQFLDNIPSLPMTISPHSLGLPYFPFRMQVGIGSYESGESFDVYAYLVHEGTKNAIIRFLSHDSTGDEEFWTLEELQRITLFEPFEYLNNLTTKSNGTKPGSSARAAKIRSVVSYYFFLAENEGLIGYPRVTIGEAFGKRLCAACTELQEANLGNNHDTGDDKDDDNYDDDTDIDNPEHEPTQPVNTTEEADTELAREEESNDEPSCIVTFNVPGSEVEQDQRQYGLDGLPLEEVSDSDLSALQLELRPPSQMGRESSELSPDAPSNIIDDLDNLITVNGIGKSRLNAFLKEQVHSLNATTGRDKARTGDQPANTSPVADTTTTEGRRATTRLDSVHVAVSAHSSPIQKAMTINSAVAEGEETDPRPSTEQLSQAPGIDGFENKNTDVEWVSMNTFSSSSPAQGRPHTASIGVNETRVRLVSNSSLSGLDANILVTQVLNNKPLTPEPSAERESKAQPAVTDAPDVLSEAREIIELSSDDDADEALQPALGNEIERTPKASNRLRDEIDLTQLSSSPRGKKRKSILIFDSDDDIIEEVDDRGWRRAPGSRR